MEGDTGHRGSRDCLTQGKSLNISELHILLYQMRTPAQVSSQGLSALKFSGRSFKDKEGDLTGSLDVSVDLDLREQRRREE